MHKNLTKLVGEERRFEIQHNDTVIFEQTGIFPRTYFYPGNRKNEEAIACASVDRVGTRIRQIDIGSVSYTHLIHLIKAIIGIIQELIGFIIIKKYIWEYVKTFSQ